MIYRLRIGCMPGISSARLGISVPELGQYSAPFKIGSNIYDGVFRDTLRFFYYARSGVPITEPYAEGYPRQSYFEHDNAATYHDQALRRYASGRQSASGSDEAQSHAGHTIAATARFAITLTRCAR